MTDITTQFPLPWSIGSYGFDIKASNGLHVDEICSASDEDGDKELAALICRAVNSHAALVEALEDALRQGEETQSMTYGLLLKIDAAIASARGQEVSP